MERNSPAALHEGVQKVIPDDDETLVGSQRGDTGGDAGVAPVALSDFERGDYTTRVMALVEILTNFPRAVMSRSNDKAFNRGETLKVAARLTSRNLDVGKN